MNREEVLRAAQLLREGALVAFATETVYGLGANAHNERAIAEIYRVKGRPQFNPLIIHVTSAGMAQEEVEWNMAAQNLADAFWPGPLTLVLPRAEGSRVSLLACAGLDTIGVRMPDHALALALIREADVPLAAPSANRSGHVSPTTAQHVRDEFGDAVHVLDGGACRVGVESTVIDVTHDVPTVLRPGGVTLEQLREVLPDVRMHDASDETAPASPGMLASHYAPSIPVRLNAARAEKGEVLLGFGSCECTLNLSESGDLAEAAANLFAYLRRLDDPRYRGIAVMTIPEEGLGVAINDRLRRAASTS